jgi:iron complex outermembrane receptor protein
VNEAFGDAVNWDLIPDFALSRLDVVGANPVYGLNALGGAVVVTTKTGFDYHGGDAELSGGSFGNRSAVAQFGMERGPLGFYVGGKALDQSGWRVRSSDSVRQSFADVGMRSGPLSADLNYTHADNRLQGQGAAPVQELAVNRSLVFTGPQVIRNALDFGALDVDLSAADRISLQAVLYYRDFSQSVENGNTTNFTACTAPADTRFLCQPDAETPLTDARGTPLPDVSLGGVVPIGENDREAIHSVTRGAALQFNATRPLGSLGNQFSLGATLDYAHTEVGSSTEVGRIGSQLLVQPTGLVVFTAEGLSFGATPVALRATLAYSGVFATDTLDVGDNLSLTASARYNVVRVDLEDRRGAELSGDSRFERLNPALGATYRISPAMTAYAGLSQNTRAPTASEIECSNALRPCLLPSNLASDPPSLRQVIAHTYEFGVRGAVAPFRESADRITWNASVFHTRLDDDIYGVATSLNDGFFRNVGATERQGIEIAGSYQEHGWSAFLSYSYVDATFRSPLTLSSPANPAAGAAGMIFVAPGDRLPGIPRHRMKLGLDVEAWPGWTIGASLAAVSSQYYRGDESNQNSPLDGFTVVALHSAWKFGDGVEVFAAVQNLFDARYSTLGAFGDPTGIGAPGIPPSAPTSSGGVDNRFVSPAAPRSVIGGIRIKF